MVIIVIVNISVVILMIINLSVVIIIIVNISVVIIVIVNISVVILIIVNLSVLILIINLRFFPPDAHHSTIVTSSTPSTLVEHSIFLAISFFRTLKPISSLFPTFHHFSAPVSPCSFPDRPVLTSTRHGLRPTST